MISKSFIYRPLVWISDSSNYLYNVYRSVMIDNNFVKLQIWDTAGQERFKGVTKTYYSCADVVIIAYDVNQDKTFEEAH